jgi:hypothetical protein
MSRGNEPAGIKHRCRRVFSAHLVAQAERRVRPDAELRPALTRHPEHFGDDDGRECVGDDHGQVGFAALVGRDELVDEPISDGPDARLERGDGCRPERAGDELAQPRVVWWIGADDDPDAFGGGADVELGRECSGSRRHR